MLTSLVFCYIIIISHRTPEYRILSTQQAFLGRRQNIIKQTNTSNSLTVENANLVSFTFQFTRAGHTNVGLKPMVVFMNQKVVWSIKCQEMETSSIVLFAPQPKDVQFPVI